VAHRPGYPLVGYDQRPLLRRRLRVGDGDGNLTVASGGELIVAFSGSNLTVGGNLGVQPGRHLGAGLRVKHRGTCLDNPSGTATGWVGTNLTVDGAFAVIVHATYISGNVTQTGGGGGLNCNGQAALLGAPYSATYEDVTIGKNASISGWRSCWLGFFRAFVGGTRSGRCTDALKNLPSGWRARLWTPATLHRARTSRSHPFGPAV
jgi:hypothetical protein